MGSEKLRPLFDHAPFCSLVCLRAYVQEGIESLEGAADGHSQEVCSDLRELILDLVEVWDALEHAHTSALRLT